MTRLSALLDACVLFPYFLSDTLLRAVEEELYQVCLSERIIEEAVRNRLLRGKTTELRAASFREVLFREFGDSFVEAPEELERVVMNHLGDRHVLASAIKAKVDVIVTANLKHFPKSSLAPWGIEAIHPNDFLSGLCDEHGDDALYELICNQASSYKRSFDQNNPDKKPPVTDLELLSRFDSSHPSFVRRMLLHGHGHELKEFAQNTLMTVTQSEGEQRCLNGQNYKICTINDGVVITEKATEREVFRSSNNSYVGNPTVRDIEIFHKASAESGISRASLASKKASVFSKGKLTS